MKKFSFKARVWRWPGYAGWHFVNLPKDIAGAIKKSSKTYSSGFVRVSAAVGKSVWETALFPHKESETYLLSIKKSVRKAEGIYEDDTIRAIVTVNNTRTPTKTFGAKVYEVVKKIPKGKTLTYREVAAKAGSPRAFRAVGNILNKNYDPKIPCHRVVRSDGITGGYNRGSRIKAKMLKQEALNSQ
jgi:O-6-methylguanine DNA methyltransferase